MLTDARNVPMDVTIQADVCIIGAGPAGISIARELIGTGLRVCLLESGGREVKRDIMEMTHGDSVGLPYYPLYETRARAFGGTSHYWPEEASLRSRPLDPIDFESRPEIPDSGWPFGRDLLDPYYERAHKVCGLGEFDYVVSRFEDRDKTPRIEFADGAADTAMFRFGQDITVFPGYLDELEKTSKVNVMLYANVVELVTSDDGRCLDHLEVVGLWKTAFRVEARTYILAAGGIENARLLLASNSIHMNGLGNRNDLVGRFFMEHLRVQTGVLVPVDSRLPARLDLYRRHYVNGQKIIGVVAIPPETLRTAGILNGVVYLKAVDTSHTSDTYRSMAVLAKALRSRSEVTHEAIGRHLKNVASHPFEAISAVSARVRSRQAGNRVIQLTLQCEQAPNPESRVTLSDHRDPLGFARARLDWRLTDLDVRSIRKIQDIVDLASRRSNLGYISQLFGTEDPPAPIRGNWHHMGTTRMHRSPRKGVVDVNCRVHDIANLYVAGSSTFPSSGYANPTLTIVALALRLADHLKSQLAMA